MSNPMVNATYTMNILISTAGCERKPTGRDGAESHRDLSILRELHQTTLLTSKCEREVPMKQKMSAATRKTTKQPRHRFQFGDVRVSRSARRALSPVDLVNGLYRHLTGDWGQVSDALRRENNLSLEKRRWLVSKFRSQNGTTFCVVTTADRSCTQIFVPRQ